MYLVTWAYCILKSDLPDIVEDKFKVSASKSLQGHDQWSLFQGNTEPWGTGDTMPEGGNRGQPIWCSLPPTQLSHSLKKSSFQTLWLLN